MQLKTTKCALNAKLAKRKTRKATAKLRNGEIETRIAAKSKGIEEESKENRRKIGEERVAKG